VNNLLSGSYVLGDMIILRGTLVILKKDDRVCEITIKPTKEGEYEQRLLLDFDQLESLVDVIKSIEND